MGSALFTDTLHLAQGAPSPPKLHPDPMMEFYKDLCRDDIQEVASGAYMGWDPMLGEFAYMLCATC